jgi:1-deoxy-D-xylulose-5-phosphate reductoisomerase
MTKRRIGILGSTGSIGRSALAVVDDHRDTLAVAALAGGENAALLSEQVRKYRPAAVAMSTETALADLAARLGRDMPPHAAAGAEGLRLVATFDGVDLVLCASSGTAGLEAVLSAIDSGKALALANKEVLVMAGAFVTEAARRRGVTILPVDSEHNAIHQCLAGHDAADVRRLILTASGGPFRELDESALARVGPADALRHPTWQMGRKITIDSATLMNKGLEVIEAHWLFGMPAAAIDVIVHPQSVVHSMVEFADGSVLAQLGVTDMRLPIQYAFAYPRRWTSERARLDLSALGRLEFHAPDRGRFRCLDLAYRALEAGGAAPVVLNAVNEMAVEAFLSGGLPFPGIPALIDRGLDRAAAELSAPVGLADVRAVDAWARRWAAETLRTVPSS